MTWIIIAAIACAIGLGYKTGINTGFFAIVFAYLIGCFGLEMKPSALIALWPIQIFFVIFAVSLFYNVAILNGALEKLANHLMYACRHYPYLLPFAVFASATLIAGMGAGFYTVLAFMAPLTLMLCEKTGMSRVVGAMAINYGALAGANFMTSQSGIIFRGLMESSGVASGPAFVNSSAIFAATIAIPVIVLLGALCFSGKKSSISVDYNRPEPFDQKQKTTLWLIGIMMSLVLLGPILKLSFPNNARIVFLNSKIDIGLIASFFSVIAFYLKLAEEKKAVAMVPWTTLIMICGVGMLISVAIKAGTIELLSSWLSTSTPDIIIPIVVCLIAAVMSLFSSTLGVVTPALFPIVPGIAAASGHSEMLLFVCIVVGAQASAISPFSSGGSLILGSCTSESSRSALFGQLLFRAVPIGVIMALITTIVLSGLI